MKATSGNHANWGNSGAGQRVNNQKSRFDTKSGVCLKYRAGLLCAKWLVIGILLTVALQGNLWAQGFRAAASAGMTAGYTELTISKPTGTTSGDVMIAAIAFRPYNATLTAPSGWTLVRQTNQSATNNSAQAIYRKVAGGSEPASYTWTQGSWPSPVGAAGGIMTFYGIDTTTPVNVENGQATPNALTHSTPSVTTTVNNTIVVTAHSYSTCPTYWTPPSGMTEAVEAVSDSPYYQLGVSLEMNYVTQPSAGATGIKTATTPTAPDGEADSGVAQILALTPAPPNLTQAHYRWRNDDGSEQSASVAVDQSASIAANSGSSINLTLSGVTGTNRYLLVAISLGSNPSVGAVRNVSAVTSNSTALTRLGYSEYTATTPIRARTEIWALKEPPTGTNTIVVTLDGALDTNRHAVVGAISFTGVNQSTPTNTVASQTGNSSTCSINVPSASGELAFAVAGHATPAYGLTNLGNTQYWNNSTNAYCRAAGGTKAGASSVTMSWNIGNNIIWAMSGVSLKPATTATNALAEDSKVGIAKSTTKRLRF